MSRSTLWSSNYNTYDRLTPRYKKFLEGLTALNDADRFRQQAAQNGYKLRTEPRGSPLNAGGAFQASHPVIRYASQEFYIHIRIFVTDVWHCSANLREQHQPRHRLARDLRQSDFYEADQ